MWMIALTCAGSTLSPGPTSKARGVSVGPGVKHLARIASRPVTWVIKIKHAGLGVLGQASGFKRQA